VLFRGGKNEQSDMEQNEFTHADVCPECGAALVPGAKRCWLCAARVTQPRKLTSPVDDELRIEPAPQGPKVRPSDMFLDWRPVHPSPANFDRTFSLSTLFLWVTLAAVVLGVWRIAHGLGIFLAILSLPAAVRTIANVRSRQQQSGQPVSAAEKTFAFLGALVSAAAIAMAIVVGVFGALMAVCLASFSNSGQANATGLVVFIVLAILGVLGLIWLVQRLRAFWRADL
jgi:hypothetical protein